MKILKNSFFEKVPVLHTLTSKGFMQNGHLKNFCSASFQLNIKDNQLRTFSKAHMAAIKD